MWMVCLIHEYAQVNMTQCIITNQSLQSVWHDKFSGVIAIIMIEGHFNIEFWSPYMYIPTPDASQSSRIYHAPLKRQGIIMRYCSNNPNISEALYYGLTYGPGREVTRSIPILPSENTKSQVRIWNPFLTRIK
jgi:hypothetical protein